jgi:hypothetical protein
MRPNALFDALCIFQSVTDIIARAAAAQARRSSATLQRRARVKFYERSGVGNAVPRSQSENEPEHTRRPLDTAEASEDSLSKSSPDSSLVLASTYTSRASQEPGDAPRSQSIPLPPSFTSELPPLPPQSHVSAHEKPPSNSPKPEPNIALLPAEVG